MPKLIDQVLKTLTVRLSDNDPIYQHIALLAEAELPPEQRRAIELALLGNITRTQSTLAAFRSTE